MTRTEATKAIIIVGAGIAGLSAALACAPKKAIVLCATTLDTGASSVWAQGGMAVAMAGDDSPALHAADTLAAGAGLGDPAAVDILTREGPEALIRLAGLGAPFDRTADGAFVQSLEAAHSHPRVARVGGDGAGRAIMLALAAAVLAAPHVEVREGAHMRGLLQDRSGAVVGVLAETAGAVAAITGQAVILATGGIGGLYAVTTTPRELLGEGLAAAALAGAAVSDTEFMQFHPTAIDVGGDPAPLATEALRGEGAILVNADGTPFMLRYDPRAELAPRDVVARAIARECGAGRGAFLDATKAVGAHFPHEFPAVFKACMEAGIDPRTQPIPVIPAAHYHMGGIVTDLDGRTSLRGLYAAGECASTGVHGANRLASNSLLEGAVFGTRAGRAAAADPHAPGAPRPATPAPPLPADAVMQLRRAMSDHAGVVRDSKGLETLLREIAALEARFGRALPLVAARLVAEGALARQESRGGHFRTDFPNLAPPKRSVVRLPAADLVAA
ncbi:MAG: L-aspartate oxidase [Caulobacteraceae bacterium]